MAVFSLDRRIVTPNIRPWGFEMGGVSSGASMLLTIDSTKIDASLTNFPVLVVLDSTNFDFTQARSDGFDIRFKQGATELKFERERHDAVNEKAEYWVKIPSISSSADTTFTLEYGVETVDGADSANVWDSDYVAVYHLDINVYDSTANAHNGTVNGAMTEVDGNIGKGISNNGTTNRYISIPDHSDFSFTEGSGVDKPNTISAWVKLNTGFTGAQAVVTKYERLNPFGGEYYCTINADGNMNNQNLHNSTSTRIGRRSTNQVVFADTWHHCVWTYSGEYANATDVTGLVYFVDGVKITDYTTTNAQGYAGMSDRADDVNIGAGLRTSSEWGSFVNGIIDEVRISKSLRSDAWIKADYHSCANTLITFGGA